MSQVKFTARADASRSLERVGITPPGEPVVYARNISWTPAGSWEHCGVKTASSSPRQVSGRGVDPARCFFLPGRVLGSDGVR